MDVVSDAGFEPITVGNFQCKLGDFYKLGIVLDMLMFIAYYEVWNYMYKCTIYMVSTIILAMFYKRTNLNIVNMAKLQIIYIIISMYIVTI